MTFTSLFDASTNNIFSGLCNFGRETGREKEARSTKGSQKARLGQALIQLLCSKTCTAVYNTLNATFPALFICRTVIRERNSFLLITTSCSQSLYNVEVLPAIAGRQCRSHRDVTYEAWPQPRVSSTQFRYPVLYHNRMHVVTISVPAYLMTISPRFLFYLPTSGRNCGSRAACT